MGRELTFRTPIVPKKNAHRAAVSRYGKIYQYRPKRAVDSEEGLRLEALAQWKGKPLEGEVRVLATFRKTRADCIGLMETLLDAMQGIAYGNDKQCVGSYSWADLPEGVTAIAEVEGI